MISEMIITDEAMKEIVNSFEFNFILKTCTVVTRSCDQLQTLKKLFIEASIQRNEYENALWKVQRDTICLFTATTFTGSRCDCIIHNNSF